jgi:hypothetical protein
MEKAEIIEKPISQYEKTKHNTVKWREANKEHYLKLQHDYFKKSMEDPIKRAANAERSLDRYRKKHAEKAALLGYIPKRGRPSKYDIV